MQHPPPPSPRRLPGPEAWLLLAMLFALLASLGGAIEPAAAAPAAPVSAASSPTPAPQPLSGDYQLGPTTLVDAPPGEPRDALLRLHFTGRTAADLYRALPGKAARDECLDDGSLGKTQGGMRCIRSPRGEHECWLGIALHRQRLVAGMVC